MSAGCVHINGEFVELEDAKISIFDTGFLHSDVVYDVTTSWKGYVFKLDEHLERFAASCAGFKLKNPYSNDETKALLAECTVRAGCEDGAFIHMHVTRGEYLEGSRDPRRCENQFGNLAEGPGCYIWVVKDGGCATPDANCLLGMSRKSVIELCGMEGIPYETRTVHPDELRGADEAFATSSAGGVLPITRVDDKPLGNGAMGIVTSQLFDSYWRNREAGWCGTKISDLLDS